MQAVDLKHTKERKLRQEVVGSQDLRDGETEGQIFLPQIMGPLHQSHSTYLFRVFPETSKASAASDEQGPGPVPAHSHEVAKLRSCGELAAARAENAEKASRIKAGVLIGGARSVWINVL